MKMFLLVRVEDETGVSGTGVVANGFVSEDGKVAMRWLVDGRPKTWTLFDSLKHVEELHGHGGATRVEIVNEYKIAQNREIFAGEPQPEA